MLNGSSVAITNEVSNLAANEVSNLLHIEPFVFRCKSLSRRSEE